MAENGDAPMPPAPESAPPQPINQVSERKPLGMYFSFALPAAAGQLVFRGIQEQGGTGRRVPRERSRSDGCVSGG